MSTTLPDFFSTPAAMSDPGPHAHLLKSLPTDLPALVRIVQGLMVHIFWAKRYGLELDETRQAEVQIRPLHRKLTRLLELDSSPLEQPRPPERRLVGNCRDFTLLLVSLLRYQGQPARARCGFATYFEAKRYIDHWVAEVWDGSRWQMVDAQLDALQQGALQLPFDPLDMPEGVFWTGGQAWQACRSGRANPKDFGIFDMNGLNFVAGDLVRDALALCKFEILPWDFWEGMGPSLEENPSINALDRVDRLASRTKWFDSNPYELWNELRENDWLPPKDWAD